MPALFCLSCSCLSCPWSPVLPVLFCLSALPVLFCVSFLDVLVWQSCSACPVLSVLFCLSCSAYPALAVLSWLYTCRYRRTQVRKSRSTKAWASKVKECEKSAQRVQKMSANHQGAQKGECKSKFKAQKRAQKRKREEFRLGTRKQDSKKAVAQLWRGHVLPPAI